MIFRERVVTIKQIKPIFAAMLCGLMLTGCYKGDGTENYTPHAKSVPVQTEANIQEIDATFTNVTVDVNAKSDYPFAFDAAALKKPETGIVFALLYEKFNGVAMEQAVNYFDADGNVYRHREPLDFSGDWLPVLQDSLKNGATVVNKMSDAERETLWYLSAHTADYEAMDMKQQDSGRDVAGVYQFYVVKPDGEPLLIARYDDVSLYRDCAEIPAFLNWFRYFYHADLVFGS